MELDELREDTRARCPVGFCRICWSVHLRKRRSTIWACAECEVGRDQLDLIVRRVNDGLWALEICVHAENVLEAYNVGTAVEVMKFSRNQLLSMEGMGVITAQHILDAVEYFKQRQQPVVTV